jgi:hypothetical protein
LFSEFLMSLLTTSRTDEGDRPLLQEPHEVVMRTFPAVHFHIGQLDLGDGTLFISNRNVYWLHAARKVDLRVEIPNIMVHAVHRGDSTFPQANLYCQLDIGDKILEDEDEEDEPEAEPTRDGDLQKLIADACEVRLTTASDSASVDDLFACFSEAAGLNPEPEEDGEGEFYHNIPEAEEDAEDDEEDEQPGKGMGGRGRPAPSEEPPAKQQRTE